MARNFSGIIWGLAFIVIGVLLLLDRLHYIVFDFSDFFHTWWPLVLIIVGLGILLDRSPGGHKRE
jgi:hypothetical protein